MKSGNATSLLKFIRDLASSKGDATDRQLLQRYAADRDEAAFTALVQRHGPMVFGVCQRHLGDAHDAEDAFQATFLVLARRSGSLGGVDVLGKWLYGVAYRTALKARVERAKRRAKERQAGAMPAENPSPNVACADLRPVLDEEINALPRKYRVPFVLCYLEGKTNEEASRLIGCPKGTVLSRLAWARERLRSRLTRRGVGLTAGLFAVVLARDTASAGVPATLVMSTAQAAVAFAPGQAAVGSGSAKAAALAKGVLKAMFMRKVRMAITLVATVAVTVAFAGLVAHYALADKKPDEKPNDPPTAERPVTFRQTPVNAEDLVAVTGLNVYKFQVDIPKGEKFRLALAEFSAKDAAAKELHHHDYTKEQEGPVTLRVSFLRRDGKMQGVLLSEERDAEYRVECEGCSPPGIITIIKNPSSGVPPHEKELAVIRSDKEPGSAKQGPTRLLAVYHREPDQPGPPIDSAYPRAELVVSSVPEGE